jgi:all-trans-retinol dehydrogenase (NAD+)
MQTLSRKRALVTGAASGIGRAIAERFAAAGAELVLVDVNADALRATADALAAGGARVRAYPLDVTDASRITSLRDEVHRDGGPIDVLVNNAGVVFGGGFLEVPLERHLTTYRVNTLGLVAMTHAFLPDLLARPDAHVVNVASASGYIGLPFGATYASSKWAVLGFSESLALELELTGQGHVHVTTVCPSYVATGLFDGVTAPRATRLLTPERIADLTLRAVLANRAVVRTPWLVRVTPFLRGVLPLRVFQKVAALLGVSTSMVEWRGREPRRAPSPGGSPRA